MACSMVVLFFLCKFSKWKTCFSRLIALFHVCLICEEVFIIPYVYKSSTQLCLTIEFLHNYFDLMNVLIIFMLVMTHCETLLSQNVYMADIKYFRWIIIVVFIFPLVSLFPFIDHSYYVSSQNPWCTAPLGEKNPTWSILFIFGFVWVFLILYMLVFVSTMIKLFQSTQDWTIFQHFFNTIGWYSIFGFLLWLPRSLVRYVHFGSRHIYYQYWTSYLPTAISGMIFIIIFFTKEIRPLKNLENQSTPCPDRESMVREDVLGMLEGLQNSSLFSKPSEMFTKQDIFNNLHTISRSSSATATATPTTRQNGNRQIKSITADDDKHQGSPFRHDSIVEMKLSSYRPSDRSQE
jgi:hypothetical protein